MASLILKLRATSNISSKVLSSILEEMKQFIKFSVADVINKISKYLQDFDIYLEKFINASTLIDASVLEFKNLETENLQDKYFYNNF